MTTPPNPTTPIDSEKVHYNANAWRDCATPPFPRNNGYDYGSTSWYRDENPYEAFHRWSRRAALLANFGRLAMDRWADAAFANRQNNPTTDLWHDDVRSFGELFNVIHESIDLARSAFDAID
ncbi:MAG: hypothetical protein HQL97_08810 [Magnetococcales bacterium]|nr:hypothetical protein [Magnetococcales bacterium]